MKKTDLILQTGGLPDVVSIDLPASKSISNRVLVMNALAGNNGPVGNLARCDDTEAMLGALVSGGEEVNIGAAGTAMRFLTAYFAMQEGRTVLLDGSPRMRQRPVGILVDALRACGACIRYAGEDGFPPLHISGCRLSAPAVLRMEGSVSSQFVTALMLIAPYMENGLTLELEGRVVSRPYIEMTAGLMRRFGAEVDVDDRRIRVAPGCYQPVDFKVESDWSAAGYWYELKALLPALGIRLRGLEAESLQGDSRVAELFRLMGVTTRFDADGAVLGYDSSLVQPSLCIDLSGQPDLAQTVAVTACLKGIPFELQGLSTLRLKETDRIEALCSQLGRLGYRLDASEAGVLCWSGELSEVSTHVAIDTFDDHRMAMAFAPVAVIHPGLVIRDAAVVSKSYPDFWSHLEAAGFKIEQ